MSTGGKNIWKNVSVGKAHGFLHADDGSLWATGYGGSGQLGLPLYRIANAQSKTNYTSDKDLAFTYDFADFKGMPKPTTEFSPILQTPCEWTKPPNKVILKVACGKYHTLFLTGSRQVLATGLAGRGRLGVGDVGSKNVSVPKQVAYLGEVVDVSCGKDFSLALDSAGVVYSWGSNKYGCLGNGSAKSEQWEPAALNELPEIACIVAGQIHCGAITRRGKVCMWGSGEQGQLGFKLGPAEKVAPKPKMVSHTAIAKKKIISIALGKYHTLALTQGFDVYSWGSNEYGQLGISMPMSLITLKTSQTHPPALVRLLTSKGAFKIACGKNHSCALSLSGLLYTWGDNRSGQLGHQLELQTQGVPMIVRAAAEKPLANVFAGYSYTVMVQDSEVGVSRNQQFFNLWKSGNALEDQKEPKRSPGNEGKAKNNTTVRKRESLERRKGELDGPILVTPTEKVYRFRRSKNDDTCVTVFADCKPPLTEPEERLKAMYTRFWLQSHPLCKPKSNGEIFFGDKGADEVID